MINPAPATPVDGPVAAQLGGQGTEVIVATLRALLRSESRPEAATILQETIGRLGGSVVPARGADATDLPVDVSLGVGEPLVVRPPVDEATARFLIAHTASIVEDAVWAACRSDRYQRETVRASTDALTRVASPAEIGARMGRSMPGDAVCLLDLDNFKNLNDTSGHAAGDAALRQFGTLLLGGIREDDFVARSGGDEFFVLLRDIRTDVAYGRMRLLANRWRISQNHGSSVSVGIAAVDLRGGVVAAAAADAAMYRAKRSGRGLVELAAPDDYAESAP